MSTPNFPLPVALEAPLTASIEAAPVTVEASDDPLPARLLREGAIITDQILTGGIAEAITPRLLMTAAGAGALFGLAIGLPGGLGQALASAIKFPLVLLGSAALGLPTLRIGCALSGHRLRTAQISALLLQSLATAATTMAALAPLAVVAWLSASTFSDSNLWVYRRAVAAFTLVALLGGLVGAARLLRALPISAVLPWAGLLGAAALQLTWLLRPVIGKPDLDFTLLRDLESNGLAEVLVLVSTVLR